jgi:hypothetical protein
MSAAGYSGMELRGVYGTEPVRAGLSPPFPRSFAVKTPT